MEILSILMPSSWTVDLIRVLSYLNPLAHCCISDVVRSEENV